MVDRIVLDNLRLSCRIGITEEERSEPQDVLADVALTLDLRRAGTSDELRETVDYRDVLQRIQRFVSSREFRLLESLCEGIASVALEAEGVQRVTARVRKARYSSEPSIGVEIERGRPGRSD